MNAIFSDDRVQRWARILLAIAGIYAFVMAVTPYTGTGMNTNDKVMHMLAFGTLAILAGIGLPRTGMWVLFAIFSTLGGAIEWIQSWEMVGRDAEWADLFADMVAALGGLMLIRVWFAHGRI